MIQNSVEKVLENFEKWRKTQGITQQQAADILNVTRSHLNKVLNRKTSPSIKLLEKMEEQIKI